MAGGGRCSHGETRNKFTQKIGMGPMSGCLTEELKLPVLPTVHASHQMSPSLEVWHLCQAESWHRELFSLLASNWQCCCLKTKS